LLEIEDTASGTPSGNLNPVLTTELPTYIMQLCILVLMQDMGKGELYDSPLLHYLAVRGIDAPSKSFRGPISYTPILGQIL
jgi:hypothetical protein